MYQICKECKEQYKPFFSRVQKYCSDKCARAVESRRQREAWVESRKTGMFFGRPLWRVIYQRYKKDAIKKKVCFNLTEEYFKTMWNSNCYYCGDKILTIGVDRVDNSKGYIESNVAACCGGCNLMKRSMTKQFFIEQCKKIAKRH